LKVNSKNRSSAERSFHLSIAEAVIQAITEAKLGLTHDHSTLAELLAVNNSGREGISIPEGVKRQLEGSATERMRVIKNGDKTLLRYLLLGLDCDRDWDNLPRTVRSFLLKRCCGEARHISDDETSWISSKFCKDNSLDIEEYVARCNLGATLTTLVNSFAGALEAEGNHRDQLEPPDSSYEKCIDAPLLSSSQNSDKLDLIKLPIYQIHHALKFCIKFLVVSLVADPEFQRELDYVMSGKPLIIRWPVTFFLNGIWIFCKALQQFILPLILVHYTFYSIRLHILLILICFAYSSMAAKASQGFTII
jgi:hypothetical protein